MTYISIRDVQRNNIPGRRHQKYEVLGREESQVIPCRSNGCGQVGEVQ